MLGFKAEMGMSLEKSTTVRDESKDIELSDSDRLPRDTGIAYRISLQVAPSPAPSSFPSPSQLLRRMNQVPAIAEALPGVDALNGLKAERSASGTERLMERRVVSTYLDCSMHFAGPLVVAGFEFAC